MAACSTIEERMEINRATPCENPWKPVFPRWLVDSITPGILLTGMTIIGYGLSTNRRWAISNFISPSTQLSIMLLLLVADHSSSYFDHSRVSNEEYCLTSLLPFDIFDDTKARTIFGAIAVALTGVSLYGIQSKSITLSAASIPFIAMTGYLAWSPHQFQTCKANALVTGTLAWGLDLFTLIGILEVIFAESGNKDTSWYTPTVVYSIIISILFVLLVGRYSDYGNRVNPGSCEIDDEKDVEEEKLVDRRPELYTGILMSVSSIFYFVYLKMNFSEVSCCASYPVLMYLVFDILTKLQVWKRGESLVGDSLHRSIVYILVQVLDILLSSSSMISVMKDKGLVGNAASSVGNMGLAKHAIYLAGGSLVYVWSIVRLVIAIITGQGGPTSTGSIKRLAEVGKSIGLNVVANLIPLSIDSTNATYMLSANPQEDMNVKCFVD